MVLSQLFIFAVMTKLEPSVSNTFDFSFITKSVPPNSIDYEGDWLRQAFNTGVFQEELPQEQVEIVSLVSKLSHPC